MSGAVPARTQEQRRAEAEERLLTAAAELIGESGVAGVTLAAVGERAGYSRGLASHHFGSKGALLRRVAQLVDDRFRAALAGGPAPASAVDEVLRLVATYLDVITDLPPLHRARLVLVADAVGNDSPDIRPAVVTADRAFRGSVAAGLRRGVEAGELPPDTDPEGLAVALVGLLRGITFQWLVDPDVDLAASRSEVERLVVARLQPPP